MGETENKTHDKVDKQNTLFNPLDWDLNSPEAKKRAEEENKEYQELADSILVDSLKCEVSDLENDILLSCLREEWWLYKEYAETIKDYPDYKKYFQIHNFKGKKFLVVPVYDKQEKKFCMKTCELSQKDWKTEIVWNMRYTRETEYHHYAKNPNVIAVKFSDSSEDIWYTTVSMNKWTWEISDIEPSKYNQDQKWVDALIDTIGRKAWLKLEDCSTSLQSNVKDVLSKEDKLRQESSEFEQQKDKLIQNVMEKNFNWIINSFLSLVRLFLNRKKGWRIIDLWSEITYEWDEKDVAYLESAIDTVLEPEQRTKLTYMLSKIKDKHMKELLKEKWEENPSQFDLLLQQLKPWQVMLTNALDTNWWSSSFKYATQVVSWSRWCHALIVTDVIKDNNWIITDAKIIQSTLKWWVHETTLKKYFNENYSSADILLADMPEWKADNVIANAKTKIWEKYDRVSIVTDAVMWYDVDSTFVKWWSWSDQRSKTMWTDKSYCSELVFDAMSKSWIELPKPHMSPSDILISGEITPQYACYCNKFE